MELRFRERAPDTTKMTHNPLIFRNLEILNKTLNDPSFNGVGKASFPQSIRDHRLRVASRGGRRVGVCRRQIFDNAH